MLKEPGITVNGVTITLNDIGHGIELDKPLKLVGNDLNIPQNRSSPLENLQSDIDDLQEISEKYNYGTVGIADGQH